MLGRAWMWLRAIVLQRRLHREMREEMSAHMAQSTSRLVGRGMSAEQARRHAEREFGNVPHLQDQAADARGTAWLDALTTDIRFALRQFGRRPVTSLVMFVVLAVGMSLSTLLFSYVHSYAVQPPLGVLQEDVVRIRGDMSAGADGRGARTFPEDELNAYRGLTTVFDDVAGWTFATVVADVGSAGDRRGDVARATFVTDAYFDVLGVRPALGPGLRTGMEDDPALAAVAVISHNAWMHLFGGRSDAIGSTIAVNGVPVRIAGVAPERFIGIGGYERIILWLPEAARRLVLQDLSGEFRAIARLRPGVTMDEATNAVRTVAARSTAEMAERTGASAEQMRRLDPSADVVRLLSANGDPMFDRDVKLMILAVGLLASLVLAVTCTNVSALLTGLAAARRQEIAVRLSLGAARSRIIRQLLTESALLAVVSAAAALGIVWLVLRAVTQYLPFLPMEVGVTVPATTFTFGIALTVGILFGLSPALHATRLAIAVAMRDSTGAVAASRARLQRGLVVAQIAFTQPLVVMLAAVLIFLFNSGYQNRTEHGDRLIRLGLQPATQSMTTSRATSSADAAEAERRLHADMLRVMDRIESTPGVEGVVAEWRASPSLGSYAAAPEDRVAGAVHDAVRLAAERVDEGYFHLRGIPLVRGRDLTRDDFRADDAAPGDVAIILGADLARELWAGADPIGRRLQTTADTAAGPRSLVVVGVAEDPLAGSRDAGDEYRVWMAADTTRAPRDILIRTASLAQPLLPVLRNVVQEEVPTMVPSMRVIAVMEELNLRRYRIISGSFLGAGLAALLLSAIGLYAVIAFSVGERTREIAVRLAVGARARQIVHRFVGEGLRLSVIGVLLGMPVSLVGLHALLAVAGDDFPPVALSQVATIAGVGVLVVAPAAVWLPSRRAAGVDPAVTLRRD